VQDGR